MAISKKNASILKEAHALFQDTHDYSGPGGPTAAAHKAMLRDGMAKLKSVLVPMTSDAPTERDEEGFPLTVSPDKKSGINNDVRNELGAVFGIAKSLSNDADMHRAGKAMCKHAALHVRSVIMPGLSGDDLAAKMIGAMLAGRHPSPGVLATLGEVVDARRGQLPEQLIEDALRNGELTW